MNSTIYSILFYIKKSLVNSVASLHL